MTTITSDYYEIILTNPSAKEPVKTKHNHPNKAEGRYEGDNFVCTNKKDVKKWLECAKRNGSCDGITYIPETTSTFLLIFKSTTPAKYTYKTKTGDTPQSVREMFNLKPEALRKYDEYIFDIHEPYQGKTITFEEQDILP